MNAKIALELAALPLSGLADAAADARARPVDRDDAGRRAPPVVGVLRPAVQRLGAASPAPRVGRDGGAPPPARDDAGRGAARGDAASEQDCIVGDVDFGNSAVGALMTRGFPLFTEFGLDAGKLGDAYLELEPMYEMNVANWDEYTAGTKSSQVWTKKERESYGGGGGDRLDARTFLYPIGYAGVANGALSTLAEVAFENLYGSTTSCSANAYCRDAGEFARSFGAEPPEVEYGINIYSGPLDMKTPFSTDFFFTDPDGIQFAEGYLEALEALPEAYDQQAYLAFGRRFGLGRSVSSIQFSNTDVFVAGEEYITMGSRKYEGQQCSDPAPGGVTYTYVDERLLDTLSPIQKARFETLNEVENLLDMVKTNTLPPSPTASPASPPSPTASPKIPNLSLAPSRAPVTAPESGSRTRKQSALLVVVALVCNLIV